jgi:hypothetical protein
MIKHLWKNLKTCRVLDHLGQAQYKNMHCPDGVSGEFVIERLVLHVTGISLVHRMRHAGTIFCADNIDEWTQLIDGRSYRFPNPLVDLRQQVHAVGALVPDVIVDGYLFFDYRASFPKGCPQQVIQLETIPDRLRRIKQARLSQVLMTAWQALH